MKQTPGREIRQAKLRIGTLLGFKDPRSDTRV